MYLILIIIRRMNIIKCKKQKTSFEIKCFTDDYFKSLVTIPKLEVYKCKKSKFWLTRILLLERLFDSQYPFKYPDLFVVILLSIIWIVHPISYDEMRS